MRFALLVYGLLIIAPPDKILEACLPANISILTCGVDEAGRTRLLFHLLTVLGFTATQALQWCVPMQQGSRMCFLRANFGTFVAHNLLPLLPRLTKQEDIVLLNFGLHAYDNGTLHGYRRVLKISVCFLILGYAGDHPA